jgi:hypothetical protein
MRVLRVPEGSTMEMRPLSEAGVPVSETSRFPKLERARPSGRLKPDVSVFPGHTCAPASVGIAMAARAARSAIVVTCRTSPEGIVSMVLLP